MDDRSFDNYLALLSGLLRLRASQQQAIARELRDHLVEHVVQLESRGVPHDDAVRRALAEFGDAAALAASFSELVRTRRRRMVMRLTLVSSLVILCCVATIVLVRPQVEPDQGRLVAQDAAPAEKPAPAQLADEHPPSNDDTRERLERRTSLDFNDEPFGATIELFASESGVQFYLDQSNDSKLDFNLPVRLHLRNVPAKMILDLLCRQVGAQYKIDNGVVIISGDDSFLHEKEVRVFKVSEHSAAELTHLITTVIDPKSWSDNGGDGVMREFRGALVVTQSAENLEKITQLLTDLENEITKEPPRGAAATSQIQFGAAHGYFAGATSFGGGAQQGARQEPSAEQDDKRDPRKSPPSSGGAPPKRAQRQPM